MSALVEARGLTVRYALRQGAVARLLGEAGEVRAVDGVDLDIRRGEVLGLVGESGCGKTTLGRALLRLVAPSAGSIRFDGQDITHLREPELRPLRRRMQLVFQDAHAALNPAMTVGEAVVDALRIHGLARGGERDAAARALEEVGLSSDLMARHPSELSGGQQQRVVLARTLVLEPRFLVLDEPVSMLDMGVRARVLELLLKLKQRHDLTLLFITHDLATARFLCDRVAIMYLGQVVEQGPARAVFDAPQHPYTRALIDAIPQPDPARRGAARALRGEVPDAAHPPAGCRFHPRCPVS
ncbi:MAG: ABC transporter ATP-binding protein, partial [Halobacteriales archaeon]|nr:ABC transporter ATP-binding protein [Halobacteriales archaeon]